MQNDPAVLIVEDDPLDQELIQSAFYNAARDAIIVGVGSGNQAIAYLTGAGKFADRKRFPYPNLVITDLKMTDGDGFVVLDFLRSHPALAVIPTVMLSSSSDANDVSTAYRLGASSYIVKPAKKADMDDRLRALIVYWQFCEAPVITASGRHVATDSRGKLGEHFSIEEQPERRTAGADDHPAPASGRE